MIFQFRNLKEVGMVMLTIPLSWFGAILGLLITGNDFGFMAFCGLISLSGIEVRNAIILIDHTNELLKKGMDIPTAAYEAGKRRLRPIFLTAMAAAIGVLPMISVGFTFMEPPGQCNRLRRCLVNVYINSLHTCTLYSYHQARG